MCVNLCRTKPWVLHKRVKLGAPPTSNVPRIEYTVHLETPSVVAMPKYTSNHMNRTYDRKFIN